MCVIGRNQNYVESKNAHFVEEQESESSFHSSEELVVLKYFRCFVYHLKRLFVGAQFHAKGFLSFLPRSQINLINDTLQSIIC